MTDTEWESGGEVLGIAGVAGNGQRELAEAISGIRRATAGSVHVEGTPEQKKWAKVCKEANVKLDS